MIYVYIPLFHLLSIYVVKFLPDENGHVPHTHNRYTFFLMIFGDGGTQVLGSRHQAPLLN